MPAAHKEPLHKAHVSRYLLMLKRKRSRAKAKERYRNDEEYRAKVKACISANSKPYSEWDEDKKKAHNERKRIGRLTGKPGYKQAKHDGHVKEWMKWRKAQEKNEQAALARSKQLHCAHVSLWKKARASDAYKHRYRTDAEFCAKEKLRARLRHIEKADGDIARLFANYVKQGKWTYRWSVTLGYTLQELVEHLKRTVPKEFAFDDFFSGKLHIDHIKPRSSFDMTLLDNVIECWSLSNLRLLCAKENLRKGANIEFLL